MKIYWKIFGVRFEMKFKGGELFRTEQRMKSNDGFFALLFAKVLRSNKIKESLELDVHTQRAVVITWRVWNSKEKPCTSFTLFLFSFL